MLVFSLCGDMAAAAGLHLCRCVLSLFIRLLFVSGRLSTSIVALPG